MTDEIRKDEEKDEKDEKKEEDKKEDDSDKEKSNLDASLNALTETIKGFDINGLKADIQDVSKQVTEIGSRVKALEEPTLKALEEPTDLPLKPKVSADDDIGAKTKVPDTYQSNSQQASIRESDPENEDGKDKNSLSMQEKGLTEITKSQGNVYTTETPRPGAALEDVNKATGLGISEVLKAARAEGHEGLGAVGKRILAGEFGAPDESEVARW